MNWEVLLKIEYGTPLSDLKVDVSRGPRNDYHKVGEHQYICAYGIGVDGVTRYRGFLWAASGGTAEWILKGDYYAYDGAAIRPPDCLLPEPGMTGYQDIVAYGKRVDPENFSDVVFRQAQVSFLAYTYYYQRAIPLWSDYPIGIKVDLGPEKYLKVG